MNDTRSERGRAVMQAIRDALMQHWDPIGVSDVPEAADEYDSYIGSVYRILASSRSEKELVEFLHRTERETMEVASHEREELRDIARRLLSLDARL